MKNIFFSIKPSFRERQWDTLKHLPNGFSAITDEHIEPLGSKNQHLIVQQEIKHRSLKRRILEHLPLLNLKLLPKASSRAELTYHWGSFPLLSSKPFITEFDNPYCVGFYSKTAVELYKHLILHFLRKSSRIVCLSKVCKAHFQDVYGQEFKEKSRVLYPFVESRTFVPLERDGMMRFLFIGLQFRLKGGLELLSGFEGLSGAELTVVANVPQEIKKHYEGHPNIHFVSPVSREELFQNYFPRSDVLVVPSFYESICMVLLEALSFGLGVISTNMYAIPEIIEDHTNGRLLTHPFLNAQRIGDGMVVCPVEEHHQDFHTKYLSGGSLAPGFPQQIRTALEEALSEAPRWKEQSRKIFLERFCEPIWQKTAADIFSSV